MNIFFLDKDPGLAAQYQCNKHVVKMILESAQLLSSAHHMALSTLDLSKIYGLTHKNHPCAKWVRESFANYIWLYAHSIFLCYEYTHRYGKVHKSQEKIEYLKTPPKLKWNWIGNITTPALAMPEEYKTECAVESYRNYYKYHKIKNIKCEWKNREIPKWLIN